MKTFALITSRQLSWHWYPILLLLMFFSFYFAINLYPLFDNNEGLYSSIAKHMLLTKNFIIPHLNCVPYIEKPPLLYWLLSLSFSIFGFTSFAARLVTTTSAMLLGIALLIFGKKIKLPQIGVISSIMLVSSIGVSIIARMVYFDMLFTLLASAALFCLFYWYENQKISTLRSGYMFLGLAILTKGLVAIILIGGSFGLFLLIEKKLFQYLRQALDPLGILLLLAVVLPWHIAATIQHKGFLWHYVVEEHFLRFLNQRVPHDYYGGPIYYYLPRIMIYLFPWSLFTPLLFWRTKNLTTFEKKVLRFSWCWLIVPLAFFSLSSAKANYYMIVSMPALAMLLGVKIKNLMANNPYHNKIFNLWVIAILLTVVVGAGVALLFFGNIIQLDDTSKRWLIITAIYAAGGIIAIISSIVFNINNQQRPKISFVVLASLIIPLTITMVSYIKSTIDNLSSSNVGIYLSSHLSSQQKNNQLYIYHDFENFSALAFYAPGCFKIIDSQSSDLYYGAHLPQFKSHFINKKDFLQEIAKKKIYIVVPNKKLQQFYNDIIDRPSRFYLFKKFEKLTILSTIHHQN